MAPTQERVLYAATLSVVLLVVELVISATREELRGASGVAGLLIATPIRFLLFYLAFPLLAHRRTAAPVGWKFLAGSGLLALGVFVTKLVDMVCVVAQSSEGLRGG